LGPIGKEEERQDWFRKRLLKLYGKSKDTNAPWGKAWVREFDRAGKEGLGKEKIRWKKNGGKMHLGSRLSTTQSIGKKFWIIE